MTRLTDMVTKGWGQENIWATNDLYCGKFLHFETNGCCSMHFHAVKDETWYVLSGKFTVNYLDTANGLELSQELCTGSVWHNPPLRPHQLVCHTAGTIIEVSTADSIEDNYRIRPGDSQK
jgi:quercetin dioxygenase-like cupin family protein